MSLDVIGLGEERPAENEQALIEELVRINVGTISDVEKGRAKRKQHTKHQGLVEASFTVLDDVPARLRHGIFADPGRYKALIRFSNGRQTDDRLADAHGMAIKLLDVPGLKLLDGRESETTHDFVLVDHEVFFLDGMAEYAAFNKAAAAAQAGFLAEKLFKVKLILFQLGLARRIKVFAGQTPASPLNGPYWSSTPYRLGPHAVKYKVVAASGLGQSTEQPVKDEDGLSKALVSHLEANSAGFDFGVHLQTDANRHPVEDSTVNWSQAGAEFFKLARIDIPKQKVDPGAALAENLVFSPWHALEEHRPLGAINRGRRAVYREMAQRRHMLNKVEPAGTSELLPSGN